MCPMVDLEMFSPVDLFCRFVFILGVGINSGFNLHKCKMAADGYVNICYTRTVCAEVF